MRDMIGRKRDEPHITFRRTVLDKGVGQESVHSPYFLDAFTSYHLPSLELGGRQHPVFSLSALPVSSGFELHKWSALPVSNIHL